MSITSLWPLANIAAPLFLARLPLGVGEEALGDGDHLAVDRLAPRATEDAEQHPEPADTDAGRIHALPEPGEGTAESACLEDRRPRQDREHGATDLAGQAAGERRAGH